MNNTVACHFETLGYLRLDDDDKIVNKMEWRICESANCRMIERASERTGRRASEQSS